VSDEQIRLQVPTKLFGINSWIHPMIRQWIPDCWSRYRKCTDRKGAAANSQNWQLMSSFWVWQIVDAGDQELRRLAHSLSTAAISAVSRV